METREELSEKSKGWKECRINRKLLPFKMHYFFSYGGYAAIIPFLPIIAKQIGISATAVGIGYSMIPVFTFMSNPLIGFLVDYLQNVKVLLIIMLIIGSGVYIIVLCIPPITYEVIQSSYIRIAYFNESEEFLNISKPFQKSCLEKILQNYTECKLVLEHTNEALYKNETSNSHNVINVTYNFHQTENFNQTHENMQWITFYIKDIFLFRSEDIKDPLTIQCSPPIHQCSINDESHDILSAYQLWLFFSLIVFASIANMSANSLTSVACFELLGANSVAYGRQRLFGTIGWGIVCPLSGLLSDHFEKSFISVILLMGILRTIDIIILCSIRLPKANVSSNMSRDLRIIFTSTKNLVFASGVTVIGFLNAIIYVYEFWFLEDMGANRTLLGLSILMQCLVGEVPFLFYAGWFVNKLGHFLCFTWVFVAFLLRLVFYYLLKNPWLVLPVDTLHGITFGLFHGAMASFAKEKAPKGMEATMLGFFGGLYEGLGYGLGSFLGGFGLDKLGPRQTFLSASMLSFGCFLLFLLASYIFRSSLETRRFQPVSLEIEEIKTSS